MRTVLLFTLRGALKFEHFQEISLLLGILTKCFLVRVGGIPFFTKFANKLLLNSILASHVGNLHVAVNQLLLKRAYFICQVLNHLLLTFLDLLFLPPQLIVFLTKLIDDLLHIRQFVLELQLHDLHLDRLQAYIVLYQISLPHGLIRSFLASAFDH